MFFLANFFISSLSKIEVAMFGFGIQGTINKGFFIQMARRDQDAFLQYLYDQGYSAKDISKNFDIPVPSVYNRINAHRGRGPLPN